MSSLLFTPKYLQASEREEDFMPPDAELSQSMQDTQHMISTIDPITGRDVGDIEGKPSLVDGELTMYFESKHTRQAYVDKRYSPR